jgi:hypothetical protein
MNKLVAVIAILSVAALVLSLCKSKEASQDAAPAAPAPAQR